MLSRDPGCQPGRGTLIPARIAAPRKQGAADTGGSEASAIQIGLLGEKTARPMTHLICNLVGLRGEVTSVNIYKLENETSRPPERRAKGRGRPGRTDPRRHPPERRIAIAVRVGCPSWWLRKRKARPRRPSSATPTTTTLTATTTALLTRPKRGIRRRPARCGRAARISVPARIVSSRNQAILIPLRIAIRQSLARLQRRPRQNHPESLQRLRILLRPISVSLRLRPHAARRQFEVHTLMRRHRLRLEPVARARTPSALALFPPKRYI